MLPRIGWRTGVSLLRRHLPGRHSVVVPFDGGRSRITADLRTALGLGLYRRGHWSPELGLTSDILGPGDTFIDGGANVGLFTLVAARRVGPTGRVVAFEPASRTREILVRNVAINRMGWVDVRGEALGAAEGHRELLSFTGDGAGLSSFAPADRSGLRERVPVTTLDAAVDHLAGRPVTLVKLDLEGAEYDAVIGARRMLGHLRPRIILEVDDSHLKRQDRSASELLSCLREARYQLRAIQRDGVRSYRLVEGFSVGASTLNVLAVPR